MDQSCVIAREVIKHYCTKLEVTVDDFADTCGVGRERMRNFCGGDDNALVAAERTRFSAFAADMINAEQQEIDDAKWRGGPRPSKTIWDVLRDNLGVQP